MKRKISKEASVLIAIGKLAGRKAAEENFALGMPIVIEEDGYVIELDKNGKKKKIQKIEKINFKNGS